MTIKVCLHVYSLIRAKIEVTYQTTTVHLGKTEIHKKAWHESA